MRLRREQNNLVVFIYFSSKDKKQEKKPLNAPVIRISAFMNLKIRIKYYMLC
jgi:hypothetical protein